MPAPLRSRGLELVATLCFVLSGACGLVYEVLWFKRFAHVWGSSSLAMASVVACFLAGLGLGAWWLGRKADRIQRPLFAYALCEFGIALWAVCVPFATPWCARVAAAATPSLEGHPLALSAVRVATTFLAIAPACILMGATLPLLVRSLANGGRGVGRATAWLYAFNAAGASAGAWVAGFHLLPAIGLDGTNFVTAATSAGIGALAMVADRTRAPTNAPEDSSQSTTAAPAQGHEASELAGDTHAPRFAVNSAALLSGFGALVLQMLWGRELALLVGPTTYAFSALLVVFVAGLGSGSLCFALFGRALGDARRWIAIATLLVVAGTLAGRIAEPKLALMVGSVQDLRASAAFNAFVCSGVSAALELVATFAMGAFFPALVALISTDATRAGASVGRIYAWNTLGSITGALCAFTVLVPWIGTQATLAVALACYVVALALTLAPRWNARELELGLAVAAVAMLALPWWRTSDPRATNLGLYMYGSDTAESLSASGSRVVYFKEGASSNVLALETDADEQTPGAPPRIKSLRVNGKVDASNWNDMQMQLGAAYFPLLLRPDARSLLVIGMGSGTTAGAALLFPKTQVTCCELEPAIIEAARNFAPENKNPHASERFHSVVDDGRNHVQAHANFWDLIISEPSNPWIAGVSNLYTSEFYSVAKSRLSRNGMFVQWVQTYGLSSQQYALIAETALGVFPQVALLRLNENDTLLLCANDPIVPDRATIDRSQALIDEMTDVREDLTKQFASSDLRSLLLSVLMLDRSGLEVLCKATGTGERNTDANLKLEFNAPRDLFEMPHRRGAQPAEAIYAAFDPRSASRMINAWGWSDAQAMALRAQKLALIARHDATKAYALNELLLAYEPDDAQALADQLGASPPTDSDEFEAAITQIVSRSPADAARVAKSWLDQGQFPRAKSMYQALLVSMPDSPTVLAELALCLVNLAQPDEARALLVRARKIDPLNGLVRSLERMMEKP